MVLRELLSEFFISPGLYLLENKIAVITVLQLAFLKLFYKSLSASSSYHTLSLQSLSGGAASRGSIYCCERPK